jgi:hypothetical protein
MQPIHEFGQRSYFDKYEPQTKIGQALGNTKAGDGYLFRGRGFVQLTGRANYRRAGEKLNADLLGSPDLALNPEHAAMILIKGCLEGWFTGKRLGDYIGNGKLDFVGARRVVNGIDRADLIAGYARTFRRALAEATKFPTPPADEIPHHPAPPQSIPAEPAYQDDQYRPEPDDKAVMGILGWLAFIVMLVAIGWSVAHFVLPHIFPSA